MPRRVHSSSVAPRAAGLAAFVTAVFASVSFAQGVPPHAPSDPAAPPQQPGAIASQQQKEHVKTEKKLARDADREADRKVKKDSESERKRVAEGDSGKTEVKRR